MVLEDYIPWISLAIALSAIVLISFYVRRTPRVFSESGISEEVLRSIISEVNRRLDRQDKKILNHEVKMDILEVRLSRSVNEANDIAGDKVFRQWTTSGHNTAVTRTSNDNVASQKSQKSQPDRSVSIDDTSKKVLEILSKGHKSPREIQVHIGRSREHTARLMKKLYEEGLVVRDESKRPFVYRLKREGNGTTTASRGL